MRNCSLFDSVIWKFLKSPRSQLKYAGPYIAGSSVGPFWPICVGKLKQSGFMYWCGPRCEVGLHVRIGLSWILGVPSNDTLLSTKPVPGMLKLLRFIPKLPPELKPVRLAPLCHWVMPETCQPLMKP